MLDHCSAEFAVSARSYDSATRQDESLDGWDQEYVALSPGPYRGRVASVRLAGIEIFRETVNQPCINRFCMPPGRAFVALSLRHSSTTRNRLGEYRGGEGFVLSFSEGAQVVSSGPVDLVGITLDRAGADYGLPEGVHRWTRLGGNTSASADWLAAMIGAFAAGHGSDDLARLAPDLIRDRLTLHLQAQTPAPARRASALTREILALIGRAGPEDLTVSALSAQLATPPATLRRTFRDLLDRDLDATLTFLRLSLAQRCLERARPGQTTVARVATDHGFLHWGRFAQVYRAQFGERPADTLRLPPGPGTTGGGRDNPR